MKIKPVYIYIGIFVIAIIVLISVDFGTKKTEPDTLPGKEMPHDAIHGHVNMPNDSIHGSISAEDLPNKSNVKPEYYKRLDSLRTAYEKNPGDSSVAAQYASYLLAGHGASKAVKIYEDLVKRYPNSPKISKDAAYVYFEVGNIDKAEKLLTKVVRLNPNDLNAYYNLGLMKLTKKDSAGAKKIWQDIADKHPETEAGEYAKIALARLTGKSPH